MVYIRLFLCDINYFVDMHDASSMNRDPGSNDDPALSYHRQEAAQQKQRTS
jgi:hypothetical protein